MSTDAEFYKWARQMSDHLAESDDAVDMGWLLSGPGASGEKAGEHWYTLAGQTTKHLIDGGSFYGSETYAKTFCRIEHHYRRFHRTTSPEGDKQRCRACLAVDEVRNEVRVAGAALMHLIWITADESG